jgi:hypothetical protein
VAATTLDRIRPRACVHPVSRCAAALLALAALVAHAGDSAGFRMEVDQSLGSEVDDLASVLPGTIACIVEKKPERCGITDFGVAHLSESQLRARFSGEVVVVSASGRAGTKGEIRVEFTRAGDEVGVIYFRRIRGVYSPVAVMVAIP